MPDSGGPLPATLPSWSPANLKGATMSGFAPVTPPPLRGVIPTSRALSGGLPATWLQHQQHLAPCTLNITTASEASAAKKLRRNRRKKLRRNRRITVPKSREKNYFIRNSENYPELYPEQRLRISRKKLSLFWTPPPQAPPEPKCCLILDPPRPYFGPPQAFSGGGSKIGTPWGGPK